MPLWLGVLVGGAAGSLARYGLSHVLQQSLGRDFPYGTLAVNVLGSLAAGLVYSGLLARGAGPEWRALLLVGFLGGFTTFSAFSLETLVLFQEGQAGRAALSVLLNLLLCLAACGLGLWLARPGAAA
jgi:CrcB protein